MNNGWRIAWLYLVLLVSLPAAAQEPFNDDKPFAEAHIILQVSQAEASRQSLALDIANNLGKHYGSQDLVDIQLIAFGPGVPLLFEDSPFRERVESLMLHGVRFFVCGNTLDTLERRDGRRAQLLAGVETVQTGAAYMIEQIIEGYVHVHP